MTPDPPRLTAEDLGAPLGRRATVVQLSSAFCAPCRATRRILERLVATDDGVVHVELDVADRADLGERWAVTVTPTVLVLDRDGVVVRRASGAPTLAQARAAVLAAAADGGASGTATAGAPGVDVGDDVARGTRRAERRRGDVSGG